MLFNLFNFIEKMTSLKFYSMDKYDIHFIDKVIDLVTEGEKRIVPTSGKDLILIIGKTQTGKSTLINALLGVHFEEQEDETLAAVPPESIIAPVGSKQGGGVSCTKWPALYVSSTSNTGFLDTQGFFDMRGDREANIASSILMEMAINQAKSVKVVCLIKYSSIKDGMSDFHQIGEEISRIIRKDDAPIFFLFNRFQPSKVLIKKGFFNWTEESQNLKIKEELKNCFKIIENGSETIMKDGWKRVFNRAKEMGIVSNNSNEDMNDDDINAIASNEELAKILDNDPEIKQINERMKYTTFLKKSFDNEYYGYIDPTSEFSIQNCLNDLSNFPEIDQSSTAFNDFNSDRIYFNQILHKRIENDNLYLKQLIFSLQYPEDLIEALIQQLTHNIEEHNSRLSEINDKGITDEMLNNFNNEMFQMKKKLTQQISSLEEKRYNIQKFIDDFLNKEPQEIWKDEFVKIRLAYLGLCHWDNHLVKYDLNIPYVRVQEDLFKNTYRGRVISDSSPNYEVWYHTYYWPFGHSWLYKYGGTVRLFALPKDIEPDVIPNKQKELENVLSQSNKIKNDLIQINENAQNQIAINLGNLIRILRSQINSLKEIKSNISKTMSIWNPKIDENSVEKTKIDEIESHYRIVRKLYKDVSQNDSVNEFVNLYQAIDMTHRVDNIPKEIEEMISEGIFLFQLNVSDD